MSVCESELVCELVCESECECVSVWVSVYVCVRAYAHVSCVGVYANQNLTLPITH